MEDPIDKLRRLPVIRMEKKIHGIGKVLSERIFNYVHEPEFVNINQL